jgi:NAD+ synthase
VLDAILRCLIEQDLGVEETIKAGHDPATVVKVARMIAISEYKRRQATPGPKISTRAFARERRYPMTNGFTKLLKNKGKKAN